MITINDLKNNRYTLLGRSPEQPVALFKYDTTVEVSYCEIDFHICWRNQAETISFGIVALDSLINRYPHVTNTFNSDEELNQYINQQAVLRELTK